MRIVIATGIYPPEVGGPSFYAQGLEKALRALGHTPVVVTYGNLRRLPMGVSHALYFARLFPRFFGASAVVALDTASVAIPAALACALTGKRFIIRTGGDFVWEHYIERTGDTLPLVRFYVEHKGLSFKERLVFSLTKYALHRATVVFSTQMQRDAWLKPYGLALDHTRIIGNAADEPLPSEPPRTKNFLWHVRPIAMKNGERLHTAFAKAKNTCPDITLEEGMVPKTELLESMKNCYAVLLPSITEISPNYILDALRLHKPFIMDKYSGFAEWLAPYGLLVDPLDENDIARAIEELSELAGYERAVKKAAAFSYVRTYDDVARDFLKLISE
jgi:glycosyltransferase involved in cell wall biosynthesis